MTIEEAELMLPLDGTPFEVVVVAAEVPPDAPRNGEDMADNTFILSRSLLVVVGAEWWCDCDCL
jgi:hypothetical protein